MIYCAICLAIGEQEDEPVAIREGMTHCRRHLIQETNSTGFHSDDEWVMYLREKYSRGK